jgi:signal transduction histidine kinase
MRSIRWRLVLSYLSLTLITVLALGLLAFSLIQNHFRTQEEALLQSNADVVARQAEDLMAPVVKLNDLYDLVNTTGYLIDARVRILSSQGAVLADSGTPLRIDRMFWIPPEDVTKLRLQADSLPPEMRAFLMTALEHSGRGVLLPEEFIKAAQTALGSDIQTREYARERGPWGIWLLPGDPLTWPPQTAGGEQRSKRVVQAVIGSPQRPLGQVQILESPSYPQAALQAMLQPFLIAAAAALLISGLLGLYIGRRLSAPIIALSESAAKMGAGELSVRVPEGRKDEIGQLGEQFNRMADRLQASFHDLSTERDTLRQFITDASHELRTPVTALRNFLELLQGKAGRSAATRSEFLRESEHQVERLEWITDNLLNLSRLDAGLHAPQRTKVFAADLLESAAAPFRARVVEKGVSLSVHVDPENLKLEGDRGLLELALTNLVDNAVKFTPSDGAIELSARSTEDTIQFRVQDNGAGIDPQDLPHVFDRFYRGLGSEGTGSGLGLSLVKSVAEAHSGSIMVESQPGSGSTFTLEIPA